MDSHFTALRPLCHLAGMAQPGTWGVCASQSRLPCAHPPMTTQARPLSAGSQPWDPVWWGCSLWITRWDPASPPQSGPGWGREGGASQRCHAGWPREQGRGVGCHGGGGSLEQEQDWEEWGAGVGPALLGSSKRPSGHSGYGAWTLGCCKLPPSKCISGNPKATCPPADSERAASVRGSSGAGAAHAPWTRCSPPHPPPLSGQAVGGGGGTHRG